ncbi:hypothetical protein LOD99_13332 [Oopsacas minuta]|uniref:Integrase catalytic domain-containing protein n=1 Tax=Oopsacas minuta TaxID=111878 RepID=A0AAV7KKI6_9METZ|nr:hypothetical protein LOD99_13332 [Oopsacas minuta]
MELIPLQDQSAASLVREFQCGWIFRGHGVPKGLLTDQAHNIDGVEIRALCERLGIEKRHSSLYHPQGDGLVERSIGLAKQVARCLTLDRKLPKESWPEILPEVSFYCNNVENSSTKFSPQRLMTGRQPTSPIDAMISRKDLNQTLSHTVHIEELEVISAELEKLARENDLQAKRLRNDYHNKGAVTPCLEKGDLILERNETRKDSLDPKFVGPYTVLDSRGTNVKVRKGNRHRWVHAGRCKLFEDSHSIPLTSGPSEPGEVVRAPLGEVDAPTIGTYNEQQQEEAVEVNVDPGTETQDLSGEGEEVGPARRYPLRSRKQKEYPNYVLSTEILPSQALISI